jgi:hypothetical protein
MTQSSGPVVPPSLVERFETKTSLLPSRDHAGESSPLPSEPVSLVALPPSASMTQMSCPSAYAIRVPSGENAGFDSAPGVVVSRRGSLPSDADV